VFVKQYQKSSREGEVEMWHVRLIRHAFFLRDNRIDGIVGILFMSLVYRVMVSKNPLFPCKN